MNAPLAYRVKLWADERAYWVCKTTQRYVADHGDDRLRYTVSERILDTVSKAAEWWLTHLPHRHESIDTIPWCVWCSKDVDA